MLKERALVAAATNCTEQRRMIGALLLGTPEQAAAISKGTAGRSTEA